MTEIKVMFEELYIKVIDEWFCIFSEDICFFETLMNIAYKIEDILEEE